MKIYGIAWCAWLLATFLSAQLPKLIEAVIDDNYPEVHNLLAESHTDPNVRDHHDKTALMHAAENENRSLATLLLQHNADPDLADERGRTALMYAAEKDNLPLVKILIEDYHADPNFQDVDGDTAYLIARRKKHTNIINYLYEHTNEVPRSDQIRRAAQRALRLMLTSGVSGVASYLAYESVAAWMAAMSAQENM